MKSALILITRYQKMIKTTTLTLLFILSSLSMTVAHADTNFVAHTATKIEKNSTSLKEDLEQLENPEQLRKVCDKQNKAEYCFTYAAYQDLVLENYKLAYEYHMKAFDLGQKESGYYIGAYQVNYLDVFNDDTRLSIDEIIYYLEQAFKAGYPDATSLLMVIYRDSKFNRIDFDKSEYYNKIAVTQNINRSRFTLAFLYLQHMKDKSKIYRSIDLLNEDLILEKNWESALMLSNIYLNPEEFGIDKDVVKTLAYAYITRDLRKDVIEPRVANVEDDVIELLPQVLSSKQLKQAKVLYLELMTQMNEEQNQDIVNTVVN